jgi:hypothetical protein
MNHLKGGGALPASGDEVTRQCGYYTRIYSFIR